MILKVPRASSSHLVTKTCFCLDLKCSFVVKYKSHFALLANFIQNKTHFKAQFTASASRRKDQCTSPRKTSYAHRNPSNDQLRTSTNKQHSPRTLFVRKDATQMIVPFNWRHLATQSRTILINPFTDLPNHVTPSPPCIHHSPVTSHSPYST